MNQPLRIITAPETVELLHVEPLVERIPVVQLPLPLDHNINRVVKRLFDIIVSTIIILLVFPWLFPLIALCIKLNSKGPVFFLQPRYAMNNQLFTCIKFRTMVRNDEAHTKAAHKNDARITSVGRFLRHHHLDELPQLFNVFMGDMSMIGPRPHMVADHRLFETMMPHYNFRHQVKPGVTGLAQVRGSVGPVDNFDKLEERIAYDSYYVRNWSFTMDLKIALNTLARISGYH
jgi:putative colanic acid biosysnthesis UDP-glucose lipid carrier transferase